MNLVHAAVVSACVLAAGIWLWRRQSAKKLMCAGSPLLGQWYSEDWSVQFVFMPDEEDGRLACSVVLMDDGGALPFSAIGLVKPGGQLQISASDIDYDETYTYKLMNGRLELTNDEDARITLYRDNLNSSKILGEYSE